MEDLTGMDENNSAPSDPISEIEYGHWLLARCDTRALRGKSKQTFLHTFYGV